MHHNTQKKKENLKTNTHKLYDENGIDNKQ